MKNCPAASSVIFTESLPSYFDIYLENPFYSGILRTWSNGTVLSKEKSHWMYLCPFLINLIVISTNFEENYTTPTIKKHNFYRVGNFIVVLSLCCNEIRLEIDNCTNVHKYAFIEIFTTSNFFIVQWLDPWCYMDGRRSLRSISRYW